MVGKGREEQGERIEQGVRKGARRVKVFLQGEIFKEFREVKEGQGQCSL